MIESRQIGAGEHKKEHILLDNTLLENLQGKYFWGREPKTGGHRRKIHLLNRTWLEEGETKNSRRKFSQRE